LVETPPTPAASIDAAPAKAEAPAEASDRISIDTFRKLDLRVARVIEASLVDGSDKLLRLSLDLGSERRQVFAGIRGVYEPAALVGRLIVMVANLEPRKMRFGVSEGMVLCASAEDAGLFRRAAGDAHQLSPEPERERRAGQLLLTGDIGGSMLGAGLESLR